MPSEFVGLCVGGPYDGEYHVGTSPTLRLQAQINIPPLAMIADVSPHTATCNAIVYNFEEIVTYARDADDKKRYGFWACEGDVRHVLDKLCQTYVETAKRRKNAREQRRRYR